MLPIYCVNLYVQIQRAIPLRYSSGFISSRAQSLINRSRNAKKRPQPLAPQGAKTISLVKKFHQKHRYIYTFPALVTSLATHSLFPPFLQPYPPSPGHNRRRRAASPPTSIAASPSLSSPHAPISPHPPLSRLNLTLTTVGLWASPHWICFPVD